MKTVVIGGTGHIGTYLVPRLVELGHEVTVVTRGQRKSYQPDGRWAFVQQVEANRSAEEADGTFGRRIAAMKPDIVIDLICFTMESNVQLVDALRGQVQHFLHCGTVWVHGPSVVVPTTEDVPRRPFGQYGIRKAQIEEYLLAEAGRSNFPATVVHPGHIVGPGWEPLNPQGHFNPAIFGALARGEELIIPNLGMETLHHVHADDVAQVFEHAITHRSSAVGESFHAVSPGAVTLRGYAEAVASWFGRAAVLRYMPWEQLRPALSEQEASATWDHLAHSPSCSINKARQLLAYQPRYTSFQAVRESVGWLMASGRLPGLQFANQ